MKNLKQTFCILLFFVSMTGLNAQSIQTISPGNADDSAAEIIALFGDAMDINATDIENFYHDHWTIGTPSQSCGIPQATITDNNVNDITFEWNLVAGASGYNVNALSLTNGSIQSFTTTQKEITLNITDGLYLVTFQSRCPVGQLTSGLDIVIIERPLSLEEGDLQCDQPVYITHAGFSLDNPFTYEYGTVNNLETYYGVIIYESSPYLVASFYTSITFDANDDPIHAVIQGVNNIGLDPYDETSVQGEYNGSQIGIINFKYIDTEEDSGPKLMYQPNDDAVMIDGVFHLYKCQNTKRTEFNTSSNSNSSIKELSGTLESYKQIQFDLSEDEVVSLTLYNNQGQIIQRIIDQEQRAAGQYFESFNLENQPGGFYYLILQTSDQRIPLRLMRL